MLGEDMKVKVYTTLREAIGRREIEVHGAKTIRELINTIVEQYGERAKNELIDENGEINGMILVNGRNILHLQGLDTQLKDDDVIHIFPPAGGG